MQDKGRAARPRAAIRRRADAQPQAAAESSGPGVDAAQRLAKDLDAIAGGDAQTRQRVQA